METGVVGHHGEHVVSRVVVDNNKERDHVIIRHQCIMVQHVLVQTKRPKTVTLKSV